MIEFTVPLTFQQQLPLVARGFDPAKVRVEPIGRDFRAFVQRSDGERLELLAWSPEVAVNRLSQLANKPESRA